MKTYSTENQRVNFNRAMYYQLCDEAGLCTPAERKIARKSSPVQERRSSKPKAGTATTLDVMNLFFEKAPARVFYVGKKSDFVASAEPVDRTHTIVMIDGIPHKKDGNGGYKPLSLQSSTQEGVTDMYHYLLLLAEGSQEDAQMYVEFCKLAGI